MIVVKYQHATQDLCVNIICWTTETTVKKINMVFVAIISQSYN